MHIEFVTGGAKVANFPSEYRRLTPSARIALATTLAFNGVITQRRTQGPKSKWRNPRPILDISGNNFFML